MKLMSERILFTSSTKPMLHIPVLCPFLQILERYLNRVIDTSSMSIIRILAWRKYFRYIKVFKTNGFLYFAMTTINFIKEQIK